MAIVIVQGLNKQPFDFPAPKPQEKSFRKGIARNYKPNHLAIQGHAKKNFPSKWLTRYKSFQSYFYQLGTHVMPPSLLFSIKQ